MLETDQLIELHVFERGAIGVPPSRVLASLLSEKDNLAGNGLPCAPQFDSNAALGGAARKIRLDQAVEPAALLAIGGRVCRTGMTGAARLAAIALYGLSVFMAMKTTELDGASGSAAGAWRVHIL